MSERRPSALGDVPPDEMRAHLHRLADWIADYRETLEQRAIVPSTKPGDVEASARAGLPSDGEPMSDILDDLDAVVLPNIVHWGHPAFLGYFGSTSNGPALLGEIAAAALNVSAMTWKTSPAATELETVVLRWIRDLIALPAGFTGVVYDTASVATLHALAAAREVIGPEIRVRGLAGRADLPTYRVYTSDQAHSSIEKAMTMLGLGEGNVVRVATDDAFRLDVAALRDAMRADVRAGRRPMAVVATVGTTSTASSDPLRAIAAVGREHGAWLHVDAAYGGALAVLPEQHARMDGAELADSLVVNPHKWLFVPLDFSALFTRRPDVLRAVFALTPEYLRGDATARADAATDRQALRDDATTRGPAIDYMDYGIQLGRRFRALKAWMVFRHFGRNGIEQRIREHCRLANVLAGWISAEQDFELAAPQEMAVVCFRYVSRGADAAALDRLNEEIVERVNASGGAYLTHTALRGRTCMRAGIGNVLTEERHLADMWERVRAESRRASSNA